MSKKRQALKTENLIIIQFVQNIKWNKKQKKKAEEFQKICAF